MESLTLEPLHPHYDTAPLPVQALHSVAALVREDVQLFAEWIERERILDQGGEPKDLDVQVFELAELGLPSREVRSSGGVEILRIEKE